MDMMVVCCVQATVTVREGVDIVQTNLSFLRQQFTQMASHILHCNSKFAQRMSQTLITTTNREVSVFFIVCCVQRGTLLACEHVLPQYCCVLLGHIDFLSFLGADHTFGPRLLLLCTQGLFECLALNLYCLGGEQRALTAVINHRIVSIHHF